MAKLDLTVDAEAEFEHISYGFRAPTSPPQS